MTLAPAIALSRFGLGPRPGDLDSINNVTEAAFAELADAGSTGAAERLDDGAELYAQYRAMQLLRRQNKGSDSAEYDAAREAFQAAMQAEGRLRIGLAKAAPVGLVERLVAFWSNHFAISTSKQAVRALAGAYEREAIRPLVLGRFGDLLTAATTHPAMLIYLDNAASVGPDSPQGRRRETGLNENHARELLELHTLGVEGGYMQADVTSLAKVLTGWSIGNAPSDGDAYGRFLFRARTHEPGAQTVLGTSYNKRGQAQGDAVLADLATHPATARHVARKLARHFIADVPDDALVVELARVFTDSDGDLLAVTKALLASEQAVVETRSKLRSPQEFLWASLRALDLRVQPQRAARMLTDLGQPLWQPSSPAGFADDTATWLAPDAMTNRLDAAQLLAVDAAGPDDPRELTALVFGDAVSAQTLQAIARAESRTQAIALMLMSPEFQRR